jgi:hypothetical protein
MTVERIKTEAQFQALMEEVDDRLRADGVPIAARPFHAESRANHLA